MPNPDKPDEPKTTNYKNQVSNVPVNGTLKLEIGNWVFMLLYY